MPDIGRAGGGGMFPHKGKECRFDQIFEVINTIQKNVKKGEKCSGAMV